MLNDKKRVKSNNSFYFIDDSKYNLNLFLYKLIYIFMLFIVFSFEGKYNIY